MADEQELKAAWVAAERAAAEAFDRYMELRDAEQVAWRRWRNALLILRDDEAGR